MNSFFRDNRSKWGKASKQVITPDTSGNVSRVLWFETNPVGQSAQVVARWRVEDGPWQSYTSGDTMAASGYKKVYVEILSDLVTKIDINTCAPVVGRTDILKPDRRGCPQLTSLDMYTYAGPLDFKRFPLVGSLDDLCESYEGSAIDFSQFNLDNITSMVRTFQNMPNVTTDAPAWALVAPPAHLVGKVTNCFKFSSNIGNYASIHADWK